MKKIFLIIALMVPLFAAAQTPRDLYEFSSVIYQGTAKSAAMGNAMGAVGQDLSAIAINPAGLGMFRRSTFVFTPTFYLNSTESLYQGNKASDWAFKTPINNIGFTWTNQTDDKSLKSTSFAIGLNRTNYYAQYSYVNGNNPNTSLVNAYFAELEANHINSADDLYEFSPNNIYPLWHTWVLDSVGPGYYSSPVPMGNINQQRGLEKRGSAREITFASGLNFNDRWFLGFSLNIPHFNRTVRSEYQESNLSHDDDFKNWDQQEYIASSGWGINAKLGLIAFPVKWLRVGAAFHTPTVYGVEESWYTKTFSQFRSNNFSYPSQTNIVNYTLVTPYKLSASAAFIFGNFGMITADYEFTDYSFMRASDRDYDFSHLNDNVKATFTTTSNLRFGTEWRYQNFCFRGGYALYGSPYGFNDKNLRTSVYSGGFGYTYHNFTVDLAYMLSNRTNNYQLYSEFSLYSADDDTNVKETTNIHQLVVSLKFKLD